MAPVRHGKQLLHGGWYASVRAEASGGRRGPKEGCARGMRAVLGGRPDGDADTVEMATASMADIERHGGGSVDDVKAVEALEAVEAVEAVDVAVDGVQSRREMERRPE